MLTAIELAKDKYGERLSEVAMALALNCSKLLGHKGRVFGNIIDGGQLPVTENTLGVHMGVSARDDATRLEPIDQYLAGNLLMNLAAEFPEFSNMNDWRELSRERITPELIEKLYLVAYRRTFTNACDVSQSWQNTNAHQALAGYKVDTKDVVEQFLIHKTDEGAADGYTVGLRKKLSRFVKEYPVLPLDSEPLLDFLRQFRTKDVPTRQDNWKAINMLYKFASNAKLISCNPMLEVVKPHFKKKPGQRLSRDEAKRLIGSINSDLEWALMTLHFGLGFRGAEEAKNLLCGDIKSDYIIVRGKIRTDELPLIPIFRDKLLLLECGRHANTPYFSIKGSTMAYHIEKVYRRADIDGAELGARRLRNSAGALWSVFGGDWTSNRQLLRHSAKTMTDHYSPLSLDELRVKDERYNPMLNLMRELGLAPPYQNTTGGRARNTPMSTPGCSTS